MIKLFFFILLISCASKKLPVNARVTEKQFATSQEARNFVKNRFNYLKLLFEQSHDPYYNTPKWEADCLTHNQIGKIQEKEGSSWFISDLIVNQNGDVGFCSGTQTEITILHCPEEKKIYEIRCMPRECAAFISCPPKSL